MSIIPAAAGTKRKGVNMLEKFFKLSDNKTNVKTEMIAGLTTFMTMAYIIALNPNLLTNFDTGSALWNGAFLATCIASGIGCIVPLNRCTGIVTAVSGDAGQCLFFV